MLQSGHLADRSLQMSEAMLGAWPSLSGSSSATSSPSSEEDSDGDDYGGFVAARRRRRAVAALVLADGVLDLLCKTEYRQKSGPQGPKKNISDPAFNWERHVDKLTRGAFRRRYRMDVGSFERLLDRPTLQPACPQQGSSQLG